MVPDRVRLPLDFDTAALAAEATALPPEAWVGHFNTGIYCGNWTGVALRSPGGMDGRLYPDPVSTVAYADTPVLLANPALRAALTQFRCPVTAARLLALAPGACIREHSDYRLGWEDGEIRVHVAIITAPGVGFVLDGRPIDLPAGEAWYLDFNRPHQVTNNATVTRIHLVVDCVVEDWLTALMEKALVENARVEEAPVEKAPVEKALST
jgi:quercetin dioxygenase-like cupin family protein